jgi:outer membrane protein TolC
MIKSRVAKFCLLSVSACALASQAAGAGPVTDPVEATASAPHVVGQVYGLRRCLELAEQNYPRLHESRWRLAQKRAQYTQALVAPYSDFTLTSGLAIAPHVYGTSVYSPSNDLPISSDMNFAWSFAISGVVPLWTFGKITNVWDAASAQIKVGEAEVQKERNEMRLAVRRAFYGVLLARDALLLVGEAIDRVNKYTGSLEERVESGDADEIQLLKLQIQREELLVRESEARKQESIALSGLKFFTGLSNGINVPDRPLKRLTHHLGPLARYLSAARLYRPEINMARAAVLAREAQVRAQTAQFFPDLGVALSASVMNAPFVTDQRNPFVRDTGHSRSFGAALALRYKLDFLPQAAKYGQARAQLEEQRATERYALGGVGVEVEQAFREAEDAERRLEAFSRAVGYAKKWLIQVQQGIDIGTFEDGDVVDPAKEFALKRFSQMSATFDYNIALARLAQTTGWDAIAMDD